MWGTIASGRHNGIMKGARSATGGYKTLLMVLSSEPILAGVAAGILGSADRLSDEEEALVARAAPEVAALVEQTRQAMDDGLDPLGDAFIRTRATETRRLVGATYTPVEIIRPMMEWAKRLSTPVRVVDPGAGSGRFALAASRLFPEAEVIAAELDPLAALLCRAGLEAAGLGGRARVEVGDYRSLRLNPVDGPTLYIGNPPYVRHHQIGSEWKEWLTLTASNRGLKASQLAGLHIHFLLATASLAQPGDYGAFITSAEWLDVNYGQLARDLLLDGLGGLSIHVLDPTIMPFEGTATTGAITCFQVGSEARSMRLKKVKAVRDLGALEGGRKVSKERLAESRRWSDIIRAAPKMPEGYVELGELCRVHRGAVTGSNSIWIARADAQLPDQVLFPSVTRAKELFAAGDSLAQDNHLRRVIDLPADLDELDGDQLKLVEAFLRKAKRLGAADGYVARNRRAWWAVGLRNPAPILATYMARRPPAFVLNSAEARHINVAHGLYPREPIPAKALNRLAKSLRATVTTAQGRTYAGGLTKFEPREMERLPVPTLATLLSS